MAFCVFMHRADSKYDDRPDEQYQFPPQYLSRARECEGDWIVYLEPQSVRNSRGYFAIANVDKIIPDAAGRYLALIKSGTYLDFGNPVPLKDCDFYLEQGLLNDEGKLSGRAQAAVRPISPADFERILERGLANDDSVLPPIEDKEQPTTGEFSDVQPAPYGAIDPRGITAITLNKKIRDRNFRTAVIKAYDKRCAITGISLINGGGRAEVQAAHIRPVEHDGPDIVSNGIALTGTAHWMFDRGLVGLNVNKDLEICVSRQANDPGTIRDMVNETGKLLLPAKQADHPRREFVEWHWENCFKH